MSRTGDSTYRRKRARILRGAVECWICGETIDPSLPYPHPMSGSADHVQPVSLGGDNLGELRPSHLRCNLRRSNDVGQGRTKPNGSVKRPPERHPGLR
ncbi:hypothetical protein JOJ87_001440 [Rhodococcus ruber]|nr:hypothetical protein [Rhodococcus ruber]